MAAPKPRPSEQYSPWRKCQILRQSWRKLQVVDLLVVAVLFPLELCCWLWERNLGTLQPWIWYQRLASFLLFRYYFKSVSILDPCGVLEGKLGRRLIFCSNHPTGLLDRLLVQHLCPWCYCLTQNWFEYTNAVERCLHVTQGMTFDHVVETLRKDAAVWVAVGGAREMHPHIRKVHTGAVRIAMQCGDVWLVPMHLAFEAHCQRGSDVLVELGQPLLVSREDTESPAGRERVRSLTREVEERLLPLTNWMPVSQDDFGKKGWRGAGETRVAIEEWYQVRAIDTLIHLQQVHEGRPTLPWPCRVRRLRAALRRAAAEGQAGLPAALAAVKRYVEVLERHQGAPAFQPPCGSFWDLPQSFKALPRPPASAPALKAPKLPELRNFAAGVQRHVGGAGNDHPTLRAALVELMEASKEFRVAYLDP